MNRRTAPIVFVAFLAGFALFSIPAAAQQSCESLASIKLPNITITSAKAGAAEFEMATQSGLRNLPARKIKTPFCRIEAFSAPSSR